MPEHGEIPPVAQMDVGAFYRRHRAELDEAVGRVLASGWYVLGAECAAFENEFAEALGLGGAVGVATGTDAIALALRALGIGPGDRVATVSHTAVATVAAIEQIGAVPILVDIDHDTFTMDPAELRRTLDAFPGVKAVVVVHLYGQPAEVMAIQEICDRRGVMIVEDCAQAHGASVGGRFVGSFGAAAAFSFYPTKNLGAFGDGGAVSTHDPATLERVRMLRQYGWKRRYVSEIAGLNSRLDEIQAAILRVRLRHLDDGNRRRRIIAAAYSEGLADLGLQLPVQSGDTKHVFHQFVVRHPDRERLLVSLKDLGVVCNVHYPEPVHSQPAYLGRLESGPSGLGRSEAAAQSVLSLPMYPELSDDDVARVLAAFRRLLR